MVELSQSIETVHDIDGGVSSAFTKLIDLRVLFALLPGEGGGLRQKLKDYGPACRTLSFQQFSVAASHFVLPAGGGDVRDDVLREVLIAGFIENVIQVDHVGLRESSYFLRRFTHRDMDQAFDHFQCVVARSSRRAFDPNDCHQMTRTCDKKTLGARSLAPDA